MRILIDTNILINLEDNKVVKDSFSQFYRSAIINNCKVLYHPKAISADLERDSNSERKSIIISKLKKYEPLEDFSFPTENFESLFKIKKNNDRIDILQLFQLYKGYVDYFITEDNGIHNNAKRIGLQPKVLNVFEIQKLLEELYTIKIPSHPILKEHSLREIENKFESTFFDSLREDYGEEVFNNWLEKCIKQNRKCYSLIVEGKLQALLIYNLEKIEQHQLKDIYCDVMKICTFKVSDTVFGIKLGELFLNKMFEYCINQQIQYLYLTVYERQTHLINLLNQFGFNQNIFINKQGLSEIQMIKCLNKNLITIKQNCINIHPFYFDNSSVSKYAIPIKPEYYNKLFKDGKLRLPTLFDLSEDSINEIQGNTITKAYISNSKITKLKQGDLLFFYASKKDKSIEPIGVLESLEVVDNFDRLWELVSKKTVFSQEELISKLQEKGKLNVITFRLINYLKTKIKLSKIKELSSFKNKIQTITKISESDYLQLKNEKYFDERYIIN